jgi:Tol biopolymer transport system component
VLRRRTIALLLGLVLVVAGLAGWRWLRTPDAGSRQVERQLVLLTSSGDAVEAPALSPDGKMIALVAEVNGQSDLFVSRVAGGARVRLTNDPAHERLPAFSPDGERVAFVRRDDAAETPNVLVVPMLGGEAVVVARGAAAPSWSPDGQHLAVVAEAHLRTQELAVANADGTATRVVLRADAGYPFLRSTAWSPDGRQIVVERSSGGMAGEIWIVPVAGGAATRLSHDPPGVFSHTPRFAPDGKGIVHSSNRGGSTNLWLLPLDGSPASRLTSGPGPDLSPSVALDGTIAFLNSRWRSLLMVYDLETGASRTLLGHATPMWAPAFSPDGREIAFSQVEADGQWHIWAIPVDGGAARQITSGAIPQIYPRFTPDGRAIVYCSWAPSANRVYKVARAGGPPRAFFENASHDEQYADISPDGRRVAFVRTENDTSRVYVASLDGRVAPKRLSASQATLPRWSPDGRWIAFARDRGNESGIFVAGADTGEVRQLTSTGGWPAWWRDSRQIGFLVTGVGDTQQIWIAPLDGGKVARIETVSYRTNNCPFDVSRDGRWLVTTNGEQILSEVWLLKPGP